MPSLKNIVKAEAETDPLSFELAKKEDEDEVEMDDDMVGDYYLGDKQLSMAKVGKKPGFQDLDKAFQGYLKGMSKGLSTWQGKKLGKAGKGVAAELLSAVKAAIKKL